MMFVSHIDSIEQKKIESDAVKGVMKQVLISPEQGWSDYVMRRFSLEEGGYAPLHTHHWPHITYVLEGEGVLFLEGEEHPLTPGSVSYIPSGALHQIRASETHPLVFLCIVPPEGDK
jgi:quercetin dioxygenase-like cupin family protein